MKKHSLILLGTVCVLLFSLLMPQSALAAASPQKINQARRKLNTGPARTTSQFGVELDSLCDMVSFGVAPGLLAYLWALNPYGRYGENPNRLQMHTQFQVILKPDPGNPQEIYLKSLESFL